MVSRVWAANITVLFCLGFLNTHTYTHTIFLLCKMNYFVSILWPWPPQCRNVTVHTKPSDQLVSHTTKYTELGMKSHYFAVVFMERTWEINLQPSKRSLVFRPRVGVHTIGDPFVNILFTPNTIHKEAIHGNRENLTIMPSLFYHIEHKVFSCCCLYKKLIVIYKESANDEFPSSKRGSVIIWWIPNFRWNI